MEYGPAQSDAKEALLAGSTRETLRTFNQGVWQEGTDRACIFDTMVAPRMATDSIVAQGSAKDVDAAVPKLRHGVSKMAGDETSPFERAICMRKCSTDQKHFEAVLVLEDMDNGKPNPREPRTATIPLVVQPLLYHAGGAQLSSRNSLSTSRRLLRTDPSPGCFRCGCLRGKLHRHSPRETR